ncbi:hypothetical protein GQ600_11472 [Phytophthora cactorum]|nr:hypothetical protein GQ600_11472 [Phytophthora cactorum]
METMDEGMVKCIIVKNEWRMRATTARTQSSEFVIRNVLRWMQTDSSAQERLKNLLHELKQEDGSGVLMIQDDVDIKCGVVIQTRVQSLPLSNEERTTRLTSRTERTTRVSSTWYEELKAFATDGHASILTYFNKNWKGCRSMWANYIRSAFFSAGNTPTNRIKSNLLKRLFLGKKTSIDKMAALLLTHQGTIICQVIYDIHLTPDPR